MDFILIGGSVWRQNHMTISSDALLGGLKFLRFSLESHTLDGEAEVLQITLKLFVVLYFC